MHGASVPGRPGRRAKATDISQENLQPRNPHRKKEGSTHSRSHATKKEREREPNKDEITGEKASRAGETYIRTPFYRFSTKIY